MIKRCKEEIEIEIDKYIADIFWLIKFYLYNMLPLSIKIRIYKSLCYSENLKLI